MEHWHGGTGTLFLILGKYFVSTTWGSSAEGAPQSCSVYLKLWFYKSVFLWKIARYQELSENLGATKGV